MTDAPTTFGAATSATAVRRNDHRGLIVIAHRGASGYRPEHTLESYRLAIRQGADFIEPDLVITRDGILVARHDNEISTTTDVAEHRAFDGRRTTKTVDGIPITGWFAEDFTLAELKSLRAKERLPTLRPDNMRFDGLYQIPTFAEVVQLADRESREGRVVGVYPETKHPTYFAREGRHLDGSPIATSLGEKLVATLVAERFVDPRRVYVQSFEIENLLELKKRLMPDAGVDLPLVQLYGNLDADTPYDVTYNVRAGADLSNIYGELKPLIAHRLAADMRYAALATGPVLRWMRANYADGIGPWKGDLLVRSPHDRSRRRGAAAKGGHADTAIGNLGRAHPMLAHALRAGLQVHPYTLRAEPDFLVRTSAGTVLPLIDEAESLYALGVQGLFIDQPDIGFAARKRFLGC